MLTRGTDPDGPGMLPDSDSALFPLCNQAAELICSLLGNKGAHIAQEQKCQSALTDWH